MDVFTPQAESLIGDRDFLGAWADYLEENGDERAAGVRLLYEGKAMIYVDKDSGRLDYDIFSGITVIRRLRRLCDESSLKYSSICEGVKEQWRKAEHDTDHYLHGVGYKRLSKAWGRWRRVSRMTFKSLDGALRALATAKTVVRTTARL